MGAGRGRNSHSGFGGHGVNALSIIPNTNLSSQYVEFRQREQETVRRQVWLAQQAQQKRPANMKGAFQPMNEYKQTWLFQANPKVWIGFSEQFKQQTVGAIGDSTVSRHWEKIDPGDRVLPWGVGFNARLLAIGEIAGEPFELDPSKRRSGEQVKPVWKVRFQYTYILKEPIQRSTFLKDPVLRKMH